MDTWVALATIAAGIATFWAIIMRPIVRKINKLLRLADEASHQLKPNSGESMHDYARKAFQAASNAQAEGVRLRKRLDRLTAEVGDVRLALSNHGITTRNEGGAQ